MKRNSILICLLFSIAANLFTTAKAQVNTTDSLALVDLYNSTDGPHWYNHTNWLTTKPVSTWYGIQVKGNYVVSIYLFANLLDGTIPASIGNFTNLSSLTLAHSSLSGALQASIFNLTSLTYLNLSSDGQTGTIPAKLGNLVNLTSLYLDYNQLSGAIPTTIDNLVKLQQLGLESNQLSGAIPREIGNLGNLKTLDLDNNQLNGAILPEIGNLVNLTNLILSNNQLSGTIPPEVGNLVNLISFWLDNNQLSGVIPAEIGNLGNLYELHFNNDQLSGTIPPEIGKLKNLTVLDLSNNQLNGGIPASFNKLKQLYTVDLSHNQLSLDKNIKLSMNQIFYFTGTISNNFFTFNGLEFLVSADPYISCYPQDTILPIHQTGNMLSVYAGGTLNNNTYKWFLAGVDTAVIIKKDSTFTPSQSGAYYVTVTNKVVKGLTLYSDTINYVMAAAQKSSNAFIVKMAQSVSSNKHTLVYPNPATNIIHLQTNGSAIITFTNNAGKLLLSKSITNSGEINVSSYANGVYSIQNKSTGETQKVVVMH